MRPHDAPRSIGQLTRLLGSLPFGEQGKRSLTLILGSFVAQVIPVLSAPLLTRLYTPSEYGLLAIFGAFVMVLAAVSSGRYSVATTLATTPFMAVHIATLALALAGVSSTVIAIALVVSASIGQQLGPLDELGRWALLIPMGVLAASAGETLLYFGLWSDQTKTIAGSQSIKASTTAVTQITAGASGAGVGGLIVGNVFGLFIGNARLFSRYTQVRRCHGISRKALREVGLKFSHFPKFDLWAHLIGVLTLNFMLVGIGPLYSVSLLGQYALAYRFATLPSALVGVALGQVYLREAARRSHNLADAVRAFDRMSQLLAALSAVPAVAVLFGGPMAFGWLFGEEWAAAGTLAAAMTPLVWTRFVTSPVTSVFQVYAATRSLLVFQATLCSWTAATLIGCSYRGWSLEALIWLQSAGSATIYLQMWRVARRVVATKVARAEA